MINGFKILAIIPAREGSKRLPNKNILVFNGKPLVAWSIEAAKKSKYIDRIIVSTDSEEIAKVSREYKADVPFLRPKKLASDTSNSDDVILHALNWLKDKEKNNYDIFILLQPTSPLRTEKHIDQAFEKFFTEKQSYSLISVCEVEKNPYWTQFINKLGYIEPLFKRPDTDWVEKAQQKLYIPNGAIYICKTAEFIKNKKIYSSKTVCYLMDRHKSIDIDHQEEFKLAEFFMEK